MTSVGSIVGGGFGLVRRHPLSVLLWGLLYVAVLAAFSFALRPLFEAYGEMFSQIVASHGKPPSPDAMQPYVGRIQSAGGIVFLAEIVLFAVMMILFTATQRAVLRPAENGFAFLRLGGDELRMMGVGFILAVGISIGMFVAMLALMIVAGIVFGITVAATGSPVAGIAVFAIGYLVLLCGTFYAEVRFSLAFPLTFMRRSIVVTESWQVTKGHFWTLFGGYLVIVLIYSALAALLFFVAFGPLVSQLAQAGNSPEAIQSALQGEMEILSSVNATSATLLVGFALLSGLSMALFGGAIATAARDLAPDAQGLSEPFA